MKVAFFGGSFDPPHIGHVLAASYALSVGFERVLVAVVNSHAFPKQLSPFEQRVAMARLAFAQLPGVEVSEVEASLPPPNYTLNTLRFLQSEHPDWQMSLLVGADVLPELEKWHRIDEVQQVAPLFLLGRGGYERVASRVELPTVSSTAVRRHLAETAATAETKAWLESHVPLHVLAYAREHGLYSP